MSKKTHKFEDIGFGKYLEDSSGDVHDETIADIDEISNDHKHSERFQRAKNSLDVSEYDFDKERAELTENFETEKSDIVKGFILEKKILNQEHEKEKQSLITNFVQERQTMLDNFQQQVKDIEQKMATKGNRKQSRNRNNSSSNVFDVTNEPKQSKQESPTPGKLLIRVDGDRILTPEQFLSAMELEEKFESEKELIEKSYRKEKGKLRDKLEVEYERKILRAKQKHEMELVELHKEIDKLKHLKFEVADMWKQQACKLEAEFFRERTALEKHFSNEKEILRKKLDERNNTKLYQQQKEYDRTIRDLRNELQQIKHEVSNKDKMTAERNKSEIRRELETKFQCDYETDTHVLRDLNEKLNTEVQVLTSEKYELSRKIRDLEENKHDETKHVKEYTEKLNKDYTDKLRKFTSQVDKLNAQITLKENEIERLKLMVQTQEHSGKNFEGKLELTERTIAQYEDSVTSMRRENTNLSHEINLLRKEKEELTTIISRYKEKERTIKLEYKQLQGNVKDVSSKYMMLEREKYQLEKQLSMLKSEKENLTSRSNESQVKLSAHEKEMERLQKLVQSEKDENQRLHKRFKSDAELLRKKDQENEMIRGQLEEIKMQFQTLKSNIESENEKIYQMEEENTKLQHQVKKLKSSDNINKKHDLLHIQNKYVKEFAKRLEYVKANYEREIFRLKEHIHELQQSSSSCCQKHVCHNTDKTIQHPQNIEHHSSKSLHQHLPNNARQQNKTQQTNSSLHSSNVQQYSCNTSHSFSKKYCEDRNNICQAQENAINLSLPSHCRSVHNRNDKMELYDDEPEVEMSYKQASENPQQTFDSHANNKTTASHHQDNSEAMKELFSRVKRAESSSNNNELRNLLRDVRQEVLVLNKMIDEQSPKASPQSTPRLTTHNHDRTKTSDNKHLFQQIDAAKQREIELQDQLAYRESEVNESKETMKRLYYENNELQRRLTEQERELEEQETSCDELYQRRIMLEKLVDRLQYKLREETSRRRKLEQINNAIQEESGEDLDDSTV